MARRFVSIKPVDQFGVKPDRPSDEVMWENLQNVWVDKGTLKKRPALTPAAFTSRGTASPAHLILQYQHLKNIDSESTERPTGVGSNTDWTKVGGASNWQSVDDIVATDSDYVYSTTSLEKDSYAFSNTSLVTVDKLTLNARAQRSIAGDYTLTFFCRTAGGVEKDIGSVEVPASTVGSAVWEDYEYQSDTDPHTSATWTASNINAYQFGYYATFSTTAVTEYVAPSGNGSTYAQWDKEGGTSYATILANNAPNAPGGSGSRWTWTNYIYTNVNSEKVGLTFGPTVNTFASITSITPILWSYTWYGRRPLELRVKDNGNEEVAVKRGYITTSVPTQVYEDYITEDYKPEKRNWWSADYTEDPLTDAVWDPSTAFTYEWILGTTSSEHAFPFYVNLHPTSFTGTDWVMKHKSAEVAGALTGTTAAKTFSTYTILNRWTSGGTEYYAAVDTSLTATYTGIIASDNLLLLFSVDKTVIFSGTLTGTSPSSLSGYLTTNDTEFTETVGDNTLTGRFTCPTQISVTATGGQYLGTGSGTVPATSVRWEPVDLTEHSETLTASRLNVVNAFTDTPNSNTELMRSDTYPGTFPLKVAFDDLPSLNYKAITGYSAAEYMGCRIAKQSPTPADLILLYSINPGRVYNFRHDGTAGVGTHPMQRYSRFRGGDYLEANINDETINFTMDVDPAAGTWVTVRGITRRVFFKAYPEERVYSFELKIVGQAGPRPAVAQFYIMLEGSTSTDRRLSKLIVTQKDFYRWDDGVAVVDIVGGSTPATGNPSLRWDTTRFFGKQYFTNGKDGLYRYPDGSDEVEDLAGSKAYTIASYIGRLFLGNTTESGTVFPDRVRWSIVEDDSDFTGTGSGYIDLNETADKVVKLLPLGGLLVAYKEFSIYNLSPTGDRDDAIVKQLISPGIGGAAMSTVIGVVARDGLPGHIFLGRGHRGYNVYMYTGNMLIPIGDDIKEELRDNIHPWHYRNAFAVVDQKRNQYTFFIPYSGQGFPTRAWTYDIDTGAWRRWNIPETTCAGYWETKDEHSNIKEWQLLLGGRDMFVNWLDPDTYQDSIKSVSTDIQLVAESGDWAVDPRVKYATLYRLNIHHYDRGYTPLKVSTSIDGGDTYSTAQTVYLGQIDGSADGSLMLTQADLMATGKRFRVKLEHSDNAAIEISELVMEIEDQGWIV